MPIPFLLVRIPPAYIHAIAAFHEDVNSALIPFVQICYDAMTPTVSVWRGIIGRTERVPLPAKGVPIINSQRGS